MKKKYYVDVHYEVIIPAEVIAESEEEAIEKAIKLNEDEDLNDYDVTKEYGTVEDVEAIAEEKEENPLGAFFKALGVAGGFGGVYTSEEDKKALIKFTEQFLNALKESK